MTALLQGEEGRFFLSVILCIRRLAAAAFTSLKRVTTTDMSTDTKWIIGAVGGATVAIITVVLAIAGVMFAGVHQRIDDGFAGVHQRIDDMRADIDDMRADIRGLRADHVRFDDRLRNVEIAFGKVDQRLLTIERVVLPGPDADE